ncbi:MAG: hypothetical protein P9L91_01685 [Candidatus Zophobacter franzmannii]|nr:hypothetical protein [Candidatus Zophobacter franzmannii]
MKIKQIVMWLAIILVFAFAFGTVTTGYKDLNVSGNDAYQVSFDSYTDNYNGIEYRGRLYKNEAADRPTNQEMNGSQLVVNKLFSKVLITKNEKNIFQAEDIFWRNQDWYVLTYTMLENGETIKGKAGYLSKLINDLNAQTPEKMKSIMAGKRTGKFFLWLVIFGLIFGVAFYSVKSQKHGLKKTNKTVFMIQRFITLAILFVVLASLGSVTDNPNKGVPLYGLFFAVVFLVFFISAKLKGGKDMAPNKHVFAISNILINVLLFVVMVCLVLITDNPKAMFAAYFFFFLIAFGGVFASLILKHKRGNEESSLKIWISRIIGGFLLFVAVYLPSYTLMKVNFSDKLAEISGGALFGVGLLTAVIIVIGAVAVIMINLSKGINNQFTPKSISDKLAIPNKVIGYVGYLILVIISCIPTIAIKPYDATSNTLGIVYFVSVGIAILSWIGLSLVTTKKK